MPLNSLVHDVKSGRTRYLWIERHHLFVLAVYFAQKRKPPGFPYSSSNKKLGRAWGLGCFDSEQVLIVLQGAHMQVHCWGGDDGIMQTVCREGSLNNYAMDSPHGMCVCCIVSTYSVKHTAVHSLLELVPRLSLPPASFPPSANIR